MTQETAIVEAKPQVVKVGEIRRASEIGFRGHTKYEWLLCIDCGKGRWVQCHQQKTLRCRHCESSSRKGQRSPMWGKSFEKSPTWRGGVVKTSGGYKLIKLRTNDPFYSMARKDGYILEHRLIMAQILGRPLTKKEQVHHRKGVKDDNSPTTLELVIIGKHPTGYNAGYRQGYRDAMQLKDETYKKQLRLLHWEIKQLRENLQLKLEELK